MVGFGNDKAKELQDVAQNSFGVKFAKDAFAFQIRQIISQIQFSEKQLAELDAEISRLLKG